MAESTDQAIAVRFAGVKHSRTFSRLVDTFSLGSKKVLDLGCSFGEHLVCFGKDSLGLTTTVEEVAYGKAHGIRIIQGNVELVDDVVGDEQFDVIWANNLFEHLISPHSFLIRMKKVSNEGNMLIMGVDVLPSFLFLTRWQKFRGALAKAHVSFYTMETARLTIEAAGWKVEEMRPFFLPIAFLDRLLALLAPHVYVIAKNDSTFRYHEKKRKEWVDDPLYDHLFAVTEGRSTHP